MLRFLRLAIPRLHSLFRSQADEWAARAWSWSPGTPAGNCRGDSRISQVPGEPQCSVCHVPNRRRQDCSHQTTTVRQRGPWSSKGRGSRNWVFRRSIAWLSDSLSTLRRGRYLLDARLASSCWSGSTGRGSHPQGSDERFQICKLHFIRLSQALLGAIDATSADLIYAQRLAIWTPPSRWAK